jgi:hypothetical protein
MVHEKAKIAWPFNAKIWTTVKNKRNFHAPFVINFFLFHYNPVTGYKLKFLHNENTANTYLKSPCTIAQKLLIPLSKTPKAAYFTTTCTFLCSTNSSQKHQAPNWHRRKHQAKFGQRIRFGWIQNEPPRPAFVADSLLVASQIFRGCYGMERRERTGVPRCFSRFLRFPPFWPHLILQFVARSCLGGGKPSNWFGPRVMMIRVHYGVDSVFGYFVGMFGLVYSFCDVGGWFD